MTACAVFTDLCMPSVSLSKMSIEHVAQKVIRQPLRCICPFCSIIDQRVADTRSKLLKASLVERQSQNRAPPIVCREGL